MILFSKRTALAFSPTYLKKILIIPLFVFLFASFLPLNTYALGGAISDGPSCNGIGGTWNSSTDTCTISNITINSGETFTISANVNLSITGTLSNNGDIYNDGTITNSGVINNNNVIINPCCSSPTINNLGIINNSGGAIDNWGSSIIKNKSGATINNNSGGTITDFSGSLVSNYGMINNSGSLTNNFGGEIDNNLGGSISNPGSINSSGPLYNNGTMTNSGNISNSGLFFFYSHGSITNSGTITNLSLIANFGTMDNMGILNNSQEEIENYATINNSGIINNSVPLYNLSGTINNLSGGTINNLSSGDIENLGGTINNLLDGTITNSGIMIDYCITTFVNNGTFNGNPVKTICPPTTTTVTSNSTPSILGQAVTFTATVSPAPNLVGDTIQFEIDGSNFGSPAVLSSGSATSASILTLSAGSHIITAVYSGDTLHASSNGTLTQIIQTPEEATQGLINTISTLQLDQGISNSLDSKLNATINSLNSNQNITAKNQLMAFINEVNAETGKKLTQDQTNQLITKAQNIINLIH